MQKAALYTASAIFALGTIAHLIRLISGFQIIIDGHGVPVWVSIPGVLVAAGLTIWMFMAAQRV